MYRCSCGVEYILVSSINTREKAMLSDADIRESIKTASDGKIERGRIFLIMNREIESASITRIFFVVKRPGLSTRSLFAVRTVRFLKGG